MSWHLPHRLTKIHYAVSAALLCSVGSAILLPVAQAATMGKTTITSAQHEPLTAVIAVSDINAKDFVASLASPAVYQQMGLTPTTSMSVRFVPTSATAGQLLINTSQPVSMPFADIVLAIDDNGQRNMVPKTLLMPLSNNVPAKQSNHVVAGAKKPNLPVVSDPISKPLSVKRGAPPPLFTTSNVQEPVQAQALSDTALPRTAMSSTLPVISVTSLPPLKMSQTSKPSVVNTPNSQTVRASSTTDNSLNNNSILSNTDSVGSNINAKTSDSLNINNVANPSAPTINTTANSRNAQDSSMNDSGALGGTSSSSNKQVDALNIQVTRQIQLKKDTSEDSKNIPTPVANSSAATSIASNALPPSNATQSDANVADAAPVLDGIKDATNNYAVQRNDSLWTISQQIAQQNNLDVSIVMKQIKAQNPEAFIAKNADLLKADAKLSLPNYDIVPSQQSLQAAIAAQRQRYVQTQQPDDKKLDKQKNEKKKPTAKSTNTVNVVASKQTRTTKKAASTLSEKPTKTLTKTLPKARFSVVAPGRHGSADGTQSKAAAATGNGLSTDILATLKSARQRTSEQAKRVVATNNTLGSYAKKLQLQNQKLAELEARLKKLRNQ